MLAKPLRTKRQRASAERCVRPLGAMIAMATPIVKTSERSSEGRIFASRFTKRQVRYRGGYEVLSTSGNCCRTCQIGAACGGGVHDCPPRLTWTEAERSMAGPPFSLQVRRTTV